jgi:LuxR family transcriptional regulator, quorum-sensing system regulator BjaR1
MGLTEAMVRDLLDQQPEAAEILAEYASHGLTHHITVPCIRIGAYHVLVVLSAGRELPADDTYLILATMRLLMERLSRVAPEAVARSGQLTARERQIVSMTATGLTSNEIAEILKISPRTVFAHLTAAGEKLAAANKTETVVKAFRFGQIAL